MTILPEMSDLCYLGKTGMETTPYPVVRCTTSPYDEVQIFPRHIGKQNLT